MKFKIYLSGPLFSQAEILWTRKLKVLLENKLGDKIEVLWPYEIASGSAKNIFDSNLQALNECDLMVALFDGPQVDDGTAWEVGYFFARGGKILGLRTDLRKAGETQGSTVNLMIEQSCLSISKSPEMLLSDLKRLTA
jgi:nucleoside 2-deoxyribosyltransferase